GRLRWVREAPESAPQDDQQSSLRGMRANGTGVGSDSDWSGAAGIARNYQVDQGTVEIIPKDLGLGDSDVPEKWIFTILNKGQIVQAMKLDLPSGKHPVEVAEPNSVGYAFGQLGTV